MMRVAPGGPFDEERALPPEIEKNVKAAYDLDKPLIRQYGIYLGKILKGDFGPSIKIRDFSVAELIAAGAPASMQLGLSAIVLALIFGVGLGALAALKQNGVVDFAVMGRHDRHRHSELRHGAASVPGFSGFTCRFCRHPGGGTASGDTKSCRLSRSPCPQVAYIARLTRGSMVEVLHSNYIRTARAKGLRETLVVNRHAIRALLPVVSYLGPATAAVTTGSVVIESIFAVPGIGSYFVDAALQRGLSARDGRGDRLRRHDRCSQFPGRPWPTAFSIPSCGRADDREQKKRAMLEAADDTADVEAAAFGATRARDCSATRPPSAR